MAERRRGQTQCFVKQELQRGGKEQIGSANDFGNAHCRIVCHDRELIGGNAVVPPYNEISKISACDKPLRAEQCVNKADCFAVRHAEPPVLLFARQF